MSRKSSAKKPAEIHIPEKLYFRIGEVAKLCKLPAYVLRFWETEFPQLKPVKSGTGQRMYRRKDVETAIRIKTLLYEDGFTIAGARNQLRVEAKDSKAHQPALFGGPGGVPRSELRQVRSGLKEILGMLSTRR